MGNSSKIKTIILHEYLTRLKSKGFIISTILGPLLLLAFFGIIGLVSWMSHESTSRKLAILDKTGIVGEKIVQLDTAKYFISRSPAEKLRAQVLEGQLDGYLVLPEDFVETGKASVFSKGGGGLGFVTSLKSNVGYVLRQIRLAETGIDKTALQKALSPPRISSNKLTKEGAERDYAELYAGFGYIMGFAVYIMMFIYGAIVMRGVIEEKANRIVEIIASSAKPFEIMMGKIVGIGMLGLTQVLFWLTIVAAIFLLKGEIITSMASPDMLSQGAAQASNPMMYIKGIPTPSPWLFVGFIFYFLSGYFLYASLFAAIGSAVDQESDAQQLQFPITMPLIIPILFITYVISNPEGGMSVLMSQFPLFSPVLMPVRLAASDVPLWEIALSVTLMIGTFFAAVWAASRVYRVGILMYGRKPKFKDLIKWAKMSG